MKCKRNGKINRCGAYKKVSGAYYEYCKVHAKTNKANGECGRVAIRFDARKRYYNYVIDLFVIQRLR